MRRGGNIAYTVLSLGREDTHEKRRQHILYCLWDVKMLMRRGGSIAYTVLSLGREDTYEKRREHSIHCTVSGT